MWYKVVVAGDPHSGKNTLLTTYAKKQIFGYTSFVFENELMEVEVGEDQVVGLSIWNTTGVEMQTPVVMDRLKDANVIIICYGIDYEQSFDNVKVNWMSVIKEVNPSAPLILVGNKKFLRTHQPTVSMLARYNKKPVDENDARTLAKHIRAWAHLECSVLEDIDGVDEVFKTAAEACLQTKSNRKWNNCILQ